MALKLDLLRLYRMFGVLKYTQVGPTKIYYESMSAIELSKIPIFHRRG